MSSTRKLLETLAGRLPERRDELEREAFARGGEVLDPSGMAGESAASLRRAVRAVHDCAFAAINRGEAWAGQVPFEPLDQAREAAEHGVPLATVLLSYVAGAVVLKQFVWEELTGLDATAEDKLAVVPLVSRAQSSLLDELLEQVRRAYEQSWEEMNSSGKRLARQVAETLAGAPVTPGALEGYDVSRAHVGLIADGPSPGSLIRRVADIIGGPVLVVDRDDETAWGWLGDGQAASRGELQRAVKRVRAADDAILAVGEPADGIAGFRATHRQAQEAMFVARRSGRQSLTRYADVAVLAHALKDTDFARTLVAIYLGPLDDAPDSGALRRTLRTYVSGAGSARAAARVLSISERTVRRHVEAIEQLIGRPLYGCRYEIELALHLAELITDDTTP